MYLTSIFDTPSLIGAAFIAAAFVYLVDRRRWEKRTGGCPLPPGPSAKPLIGNILNVPLKGAWTVFTQYKQQYGDLLFYHGLGNKILVLNSLEAISDLLDKRGSIHSDRPSLTVAGELMEFNRLTGFLPYGDEWRGRLRLAHIGFSQTAVKKYHGVQEDLAALLNKSILDNPDDFFSHVKLAAGRIVLSVIYGLSVHTADSEYITQAEETMDIVDKATIPNAYLADLLPILKHAPSWVSFQKDAKHGKSMMGQLVTKPLEHVKREMKLGIAPPSLTQELLLLDTGSAEHEYQVKWTAGTMYSAGAETTYSIVLIFIIAMALNPDVQQRAQTEIDSVIGNERMPAISDRVNLPFVSAVIKETMRWHPILPLSLARQSAKDDVYKGYFIPQGTVILPNLWAIAFQPNEKYDPQAFIPERFLDPTQNVIDPTSWVFGFGRRVCPGRFLAENSIFILIANILSAFDISPPTDGTLIPEFGLRLLSRPQPFPCQIKPRSEGKRNLVETRAAQCTV